MKKYITVAILLICMLSFVVSPVMAAQDDMIITPAQAATKLQELNEMKVFEQRATHSKADFTNIVPGVGGLKYEATQVPPGFEHVPETVTMVSWENEGRLHIRDVNHKTVTIQVPWDTLQDIDGFDGQHVRIWHYDDSGTCDGKWVQTVRNENGYAYLESVPFSEVVVGGYTGTYSKIDTEIDITDTIALGRTFDSDEVSSLTLEIDDQYASKTDPYDINTTGLVAWYRFDDAGTNVIDYSGNGNNGTFAAASYTTGKYNDGGDFDGVDDLVTIPSSTDFDFNDTGEFSICTWIKAPTQSGDFRRILDRFSGGSPGAGYYIGMGSDGRVLFDSRLTIDSVYINSDTYFNDDDLHFIVYTVSESDKVAKLYVDGNYEKLDPIDGEIIDRTGIALSVGGYTNYYLNGTLDEFMMYNRSLSESEIKELYYISVSSLKAKTNSNAEYSEEWNSSADNPLSVPFGASESISSISFAQPESIEQNGVTIYNPINVLMNVTATIGYTEDSYIIEEFGDEGFYVDQYAVEIQHTPSASNANGEISYNPTDSLCNGIMGKSWTYELTTDNPNASITTFNANSLVIDTGAIVAGTEYSYVVTAETTDEVANTTLETDISSAIQLSSILPMLLIAATILGLLIGMMTGNIEFDMAVKSVGVVIFLSVVLYVGIAILNTIATALG